MPTFEGQRCGAGDTEIFFPESEYGPQAQAAKAICRECPARLECLNWAVETAQPYGIWGGATNEERRRMRRNRTRTRSQANT